MDKQLNSKDFIFILEIFNPSNKSNIDLHKYQINLCEILNIVEDDYMSHPFSYIFDCVKNLTDDKRREFNILQTKFSIEKI